jgi:hypothetical protein
VVKESVMPNPHLSPQEINSLRLKAKHLKRAENIPLSAAFDKLAKELGFQNWSQLMKNSSKSSPSKPSSAATSHKEAPPANNLINGIWRPGELLISSPFTGKPILQTPAGMSLEGVSFKTREEAEKFIYEHWPNGVLMAEVPSN